MIFQNVYSFLIAKVQVFTADTLVLAWQQTSNTHYGYCQWQAEMWLWTRQAGMVSQTACFTL